MAIFKFNYSIPLEESLAVLRGKVINEKYHKLMFSNVSKIQCFWDKYEKKALHLFEEIYKIKINTETETIWLTKILGHSVSVPLIISLKDLNSLDSEKVKRSILLNIIHELAHFFSYTYGKSYINRVFYNLKEKNIDTHYFIQAVEFGIGGELFGQNFVRKHMDHLVFDKTFPYQSSVKLLLKHKISLSKDCLNEVVKIFT